jgi:Ca2+-binding EF-hand superfamily protein
LGEQSIPDEVFQDIVRQVDTNGDGEVSFDEFKSMLLKLPLLPSEEHKTP